MPSNTISSVDGMTTAWDRTSRLSVLRQRAARLGAARDQTVRQLRESREEVRALDHRVEVLTKVGELYRLLLDRLVLDQVKVIEGLVSEGLTTIFPDQRLAFEAEVGEKRGRLSIDFFFRQGEEGGIVIRDEPLQAFGGGPCSLASLTLRLLTLLRLGRFPLLLLDETLGAVSDEYLDATGRFLQHLAKSTGVMILLVTHKQALLDHTDHAYAASTEGTEDGAWHLSLRRLRGAS